MGFFERISRRELMAKLEGVDFQAAAENIAYTFREATQKAESEGGQYIAKKEFINATDHYMEKPCLERAITLLEKYPSFLGLFELTKDPIQIWAREFKKPKE